MSFWSSFKAGLAAVGSTFARSASAVGSAITRGVGAVYSAAKAVCRDALVWMADKGHAFVDRIKDTYAAVRPFLAAALQVAASGVEYVARHVPWLHAGVVVINRTLDFVLRVAEGPLARLVEAAVRWVFDVSRYIVDNYLAKDVWAQAELHRTYLAQAVDLPDIEAEGEQVLNAAATFLDFEITRAKIADVLNTAAIDDLSHYLRLRAAGKLMDLVSQKYRAASTHAELSQEEAFLVRCGRQLIAPIPSLAPEDMKNLDDLVRIKLGRPLLPLVFEELLTAWAARIGKLDGDWRRLEARLARDKAALSQLNIRQRFGLTPSEQGQRTALMSEVPQLEQQSDAALQRRLEMEKYVFAGEGLLSILEYPEDTLDAEDTAYLAEAASRVGPVIIACAEYGRAWADLKPEDQRIVSHFAAKYEKTFRERYQQMEFRLGGGETFN
jgi:hypothetical protein